MSISNLENQSEFLNTISNMDNEPDPIRNTINKELADVAAKVQMFDALYKGLEDAYVALVSAGSDGAARNAANVLDQAVRAFK